MRRFDPARENGHRFHTQLHCAFYQRSCPQLGQRLFNTSLNHNGFVTSPVLVASQRDTLFVHERSKENEEIVQVWYEPLQRAASKLQSGENRPTRRS